MFSRIYIEKEALQYDRTQILLRKYAHIDQVICSHYGEIFNLKQQNFRTQKKFPALIIAVKKGKKILETPENFGIGGKQNYYFSHMQNCLYDCRYCFLQGMYNSANYLWFVNYEDFMSDINQLTSYNNISDNADADLKNNHYFFSGYDADSLVFESLTNFAQEFIGFFRDKPQAILELRTKSVNIKNIISAQLAPNIVTAFSFTPQEMSEQIEHKVPPVASRIKAIENLSKLGWKIGLRFDPIIYHPNYHKLYKKLFNDIFAKLEMQQLHSVSVGMLRFPKKMHEKILKLYPQEQILTHKLSKQNNHISYSNELEQEMLYNILQELSLYGVSKEKIFSCSA